MKQLKKCFYFLSVSLIAVAGLSPIAVQAAPVTQIVLSPKLHLVPMTISNLPNINNIFTAGQYAWAVDADNALVAFYNGKTWSPGQSVSTMTRLNYASVYPAYSLTGEHPYAWAIGQNANYQTLISFFNGATWSTPKLASEILNIHQNFVTYYLRVSGGVAYLIGSYTDQHGNSYNYYAIDATQSASWSKPQRISGNLQSLDSMGDSSSPYLYMAVVPNNPGVIGFTLYRIKPNGTVISYNLEEAYLSNPGLLIDNHYVYINYGTGINTGAPVLIGFNNPNTQGNWTYAIDAKNSSLIGPTLSASYEHNGLLCKDIYTSQSPYTSTLSFDCIDSNTTSPKWKPPLFVVDNPNYWQQSTRSDGAWLGYNLGPSGQPTILNYDANTNQFINTHYPPMTGVRTIIHGVQPDSVIACSFFTSGKDVKPTLYYYNLNQAQAGWVPIDNSKINVNVCGYSFDGNGSHYINSMNPKTSDTLWLYNDPSLIKIDSDQSNKYSVKHTQGSKHIHNLKTLEFVSK